MMDKHSLYIIDDDSAVRDALSMVFRQEGYGVKAFESGDAFLEALSRLAPACILLDIRMPGRSGLDVLQDLSRISYSAPIFMISGHGDIPMAVRAMKNGAVDFIEKPFDADTVVRRVGEAVRAHKPAASGFAAIEKLTRREKQILERIATGASSREIGADLGVSPRTVETHRARIKDKLGARNAADLVRIALDGSRG
jgi:FixJ family two-component response regulator